MKAPGLGESQRAILAVLKRRGTATIRDLAQAVGLNIETVRDHLKRLATRGLVRRHGSRRSGPGRPVILFALTAEAGSLFPSREGELLRDLAVHLRSTGRDEILREFFQRQIASRREEAAGRLANLEGRARLAEVARIMSDFGFMAAVDDDAGGARLRLCHCPIRELAGVTDLPCLAEIGFLGDLIGKPMARESYIPSGDASCSYRIGSRC